MHRSAWMHEIFRFWCRALQASQSWNTRDPGRSLSGWLWIPLIWNPWQFGVLHCTTSQSISIHSKLMELNPKVLLASCGWWQFDVLQFNAIQFNAIHSNLILSNLILSNPFQSISIHFNPFQRCSWPPVVGGKHTQRRSHTLLLVNNWWKWSL